MTQVVKSPSLIFDFFFVAFSPFQFDSDYKRLLGFFPFFLFCFNKQSFSFSHKEKGFRGMEATHTNGVAAADHNNGVKMLFLDDEVRDVSGFKRVCSGGDDYVEVMCGCTSHRYGDAVGRLRVFSNGFLEITCECTPGCKEDKLTPAAFEKHSGRETSRKWKNNIWVIMNGEKVPLYKTALLKYYNQASKSANGANRSQNGKVCHRDEFVRCTQCNKERRFRLRNKEECRSYHDALADLDWKCSDMPYDEMTCDEDEERASRRVYRGCSRSPTCKGCTSCVCFGCETCRFSDCSCQTCADFTANAKSS